MTTQQIQARLKKKIELLALIGDESRIRILKVLIKKETSVSDIAEQTAMQVACTSHHLQMLKKGKIIVSRRDGNTIFYRLADDVFVKNVLALLLK